MPGAWRLPDPVDVARRFDTEWKRVPEGPSALRIQLDARPMAFFRFVNRTWTHEVCAAFADEVGRLPSVRLHGDAHVEQYAITADARGLDDFDDASRGPAVVDITRFIASLELATSQRGWESALPDITDAFFEGYRQAIEDPSYLPPDPAVVARLRRAPARSGEEFLAWAGTLMEPLSAGDARQLDRSWPRVEAFAVETNPEFTAAFMRRKAVGWLQLGIGSALTPKLLIRIEGPTAAADDDLVIEAKEVGPFDAESCVSIPRDTEASRVVEGIRQIGRLPQKLLLALPGLPGTRADGRGWWVKAWDRTFTEVHIVDFASAEELREVAHDVGAQLGRSALITPAGRVDVQLHYTALGSLARLESRLRRVAHELTLAIVASWQHGRRVALRLPAAEGDVGRLSVPPAAADGRAATIVAPAVSTARRGTQEPSAPHAHESPRGT